MYVYMHIYAQEQQPQDIFDGIPEAEAEPRTPLALPMNTLRPSSRSWSRPNSNGKEDMAAEVVCVCVCVCVRACTLSHKHALADWLTGAYDLGTPHLFP